MNPGHKLGPYEILEPLGAGGMGEVWLAQDTRLGRKVAVKVLPAEFAADPERLARFEQEARASAALNHPNIAAVFDVGHAAGEDGTTTHYMVQEYLQGHTLRSVLEPGPMKLERALALGTEIAEALRAAHRAGIVHRDLKPDNVFVSEDGHAKVLDFGLAKLTEASAPAVGSQSMSPTVLGTQQGAIMGTAGYMAPEQAQGEEVDHRADLFALGCVLYEMTTGRQPFAGRNVYDTLGRIVSDDPAPLAEVSPALPAQLQWIVRKCLAKEPARRYQGAGDLAVDLAALAADAKAGVAAPLAAGTDGAPAAEPAAPNRGLLAVVAAAALIVGAVGAWALVRPDAPEPEPVRRFLLPLPANQRLTTNTPPLAVSPDGRNIVILGIDGADRWLDLRRIDQSQAREIPGTRGVRGFPFFSPDSRWIGFAINSRLVRASLAGEPPQTIVTTNDDFGGAAWTDRDEIVYSDDGALLVVPAAGGDPRPVPLAGEERGALRFPAALPGGSHVLATRALDGRQLSVVIVDLDTGEVRPLIELGSGARYAAGHVVYGRDSFLFAAPFDPAAGSLTGEPVPMVEGVQSGVSGSVHFDVADDGTLIFSPATSAASAEAIRLALIDPSGEEAPMQVPPGPYWDARLSPDGRRVVVNQGLDSEEQDIYVYDLERGAGQRVTSDPGRERDALWWPDGETIVYTRVERDGFKLYRQSADTMRDPVPLLDVPLDAYATDVDADGGRVAMMVFDTSADIAILHLEDGRVESIADTEFQETSGRFSPDGRWLAYVSNDAGQPRVYLHDLETGRRTPVSTGFGLDPVWAPDGTRLFYGARSGVVAVPLRRDGDRLEVGTAEIFYSDPAMLGLEDLTPDGRPLVRLRNDTDGSEDDGIEGPELEVVLNWFEDVARRRGDRGR